MSPVQPASAKRWLCILVLAVICIVIAFFVADTGSRSQAQSRSTSEVSGQRLRNTTAAAWLDSPYDFETVPKGALSALELLFATNEEANPAGELVVTVHGFSGGLGDRVRGVLECAIVALVTQRRLVVDSSVLTKATDTVKVDATILDNPGDCNQPIFGHARGTKRTVRISTNCIWQNKFAEPMLKSLPVPLSDERRNAMQALMSLCSGNLLVGDPPGRDCSGDARSQCATVPRSYMCGPMFLHAAYAAQQPEMAHMLWGVRRMYDSWRALLAPNGYNAIHFRTGRTMLHLDQDGKLPSTPWPDADMCGERCSQWLQNGDAIAKKHTINLPVAVSSDSSILVGHLQSRMWNSLRLLHCCAGAAHVSRGGAISHERDMSILRQNVFDLAMMGGAKHLFVGSGKFWTLGLFWWSVKSDTGVQVDHGPASTIPLLE